MLDKILQVGDKNDVPLYLLQSVLSAFLLIGTMIDSFLSSSNSFLFQIDGSHSELFYSPALISAAGI